jgi:hypothetical protein
MNWWTLGREIDQKMFEYRKNGMNGTPEERDAFLNEIFRGVRFNGQVAILAAPFYGKTQREVFDIQSARTIEFAREQAEETGFDDRQTALYVEAHRKAYESLGERMGFNEPI